MHQYISTIHMHLYGCIYMYVCALKLGECKRKKTNRPRFKCLLKLYISVSTKNYTNDVGVHVECMWLTAYPLHDGLPSIAKLNVFFLILLFVDTIHRIII